MAATQRFFATKFILFAVLGHRPYTKESKIKKKASLS